MNHDHKTDVKSTLAIEAEGLLETLRTQMDAHRELAGLIDDKRDAVRKADIIHIKDLCEKETSLVERLGELEKLRLAFVGRLTGRFAPDAPQPWSLREIAEVIDETRRDELLTIADSLRKTLEETQRRSSVLRQAADALATNVSGILQTIQGTLSRAGVYGERGQIDARGGQQQLCVDVTS